jgi:hypothetical protein
MTPTSYIAITDIQHWLETHLGKIRWGRDGNGMALCPFHTERTPSLSVHQTKGFHCFGCGAEGGIRTLAKRLGVLPPSGADDASPRVTAGRRRPRPCSPLDEARAAVVREARGQPWARPGVVELYARADWLRIHERLVEDTRQRVTALGDCEEAWELAAAGAELGREIAALEAIPPDPFWEVLLPPRSGPSDDSIVVEVV